jgi:hypothetical protein
MNGTRQRGRIRKSNENMTRSMLQTATLCETMEGSEPYIPVGIANDLWIALLPNIGRHFFTPSVSG